MTPHRFALYFLDVYLLFLHARDKLARVHHVYDKLEFFSARLVLLCRGIKFNEQYKGPPTKVTVRHTEPTPRLPRSVSSGTSRYPPAPGPARVRSEPLSVFVVGELAHTLV